MKKKRAILTMVLSIILFAATYAIAPKPISAGIPVNSLVFVDEFDTFDQNMWYADFHRHPDTPPWGPEYGTASINNGVLFMRPTDYRGGTRLTTQQSISVPSLPATIKFRIRFQGNAYKATTLNVGPLMHWSLGTTHHTFNFSQHRITLFNGAVADLGLTVIPHDTWIDAQINLYSDRIETSFDGKNLVAYGDIQSVVNANPLSFQFVTFDDYTIQGFDLDYIMLETASGPFNVISTDPPDNGRVIAPDGLISATFNRAIDTNTVSSSSFTVRGQQTGVYEGVYTFGSAETVLFDGTNTFRPGEKMTVNLSNDLSAEEGTALTPYVWQFWTAVGGDGSGVFRDTGQYLGTVDSPNWILDVALGDLDGDGDLDAFRAHGSNDEDGNIPNQVWFNDGMGFFIDSGQRLGSSASWAVALGDVDGDGDLDAFVGNGNFTTGQANEVWLNDGAGNFTDSGQNLGGLSSYTVILGDLDGDGDPDAFVANYPGSQPDKVWLNDGTGFFTDSGQNLEGGQWSWGADLGDLDGDGDLDAFIAKDNGPNKVWLNDGTGFFTNSGQSIGNLKSEAVALGDLDGDGDLDALIANRVGGDDKAWLNDGTGFFTDSGQSLGTTNSSNVSIGDMDRDGDLDAFFINRLWVNNGSGIFSYTGNNITGGGRGAAFGDLDGDGDLDAFGAATVWLNGSANRPPTADAGEEYSVGEGGSTVLNGTGNDPDGDPLTYSWDLDNDGVFETPDQNVTFSAAGRDGPGTQDVTLQVCDPSNACDTDSATVTINNVKPYNVSLSPNPAVIDENGEVTLNGSFEDPGTPDQHTVLIDWGNGMTDTIELTGGERTFAMSHVYLDDEPTGTPSDEYTINVTVADDDAGESDPANTTIIVNNVQPTVGPITAPLDPVQVGTPINASASFTDPGTLDTHTAIWDWGDGSQCNTTTDTECTLIEPSGANSGLVNGSHTYNEPGVYIITAVVTDDDGDSDDEFFQFVVVYDPTGGFATGGGWIESPAGAYTTDPALTGKANFGFQSKYEPGATTPSGDTHFRFRVADLDFVSTSYDWLVVAGATAKFKGVGTINEMGNYGFMITATDEKLAQNIDEDRFRIKIWDRDNNDVIVYDNQMGEDDDSNAGTELGGGNIVVHKGN